jgi:hypothetical protein
MLQELSRQREHDLSATTELYKGQLEKCNMLIAEVHFSFLPIAMMQCYSTHILTGGKHSWPPAKGSNHLLTRLRCN